MPAPITRTLGQFASELTFAKLPEIAIAAVRAGTTDCVAAMIGGVQESGVSIIRRTLTGKSLIKEARIFLGPERTLATEAALLNSAAAQVRNSDGISFLGAVLAPAILAEAEVVGASGPDIVTAYAAGFEIWARLVEREKDDHAAKGWDITSALGVVAAAAAVANLRRLSPELTVTAIGIAATAAGGIIAASNHDTKALQVGRAAANGVHAARTAIAGVACTPDLMERQGALLRALSPKGNVDLDTPIEDLGKAWRLENPSAKLPQRPRPTGVEESWKKFSEYALPVVAGPTARTLFGKLQELDRLASVSELTTGLA